MLCTIKMQILRKKRSKNWFHCKTEYLCRLISMCKSTLFKQNRLFWHSVRIYSTYQLRIVVNHTLYQTEKEKQKLKIKTSSRCRPFNSNCNSRCEERIKKMQTMLNTWRPSVKCLFWFFFLKRRTIMCTVAHPRRNVCLRRDSTILQHDWMLLHLLLLFKKKMFNTKCEPNAALPESAKHFWCAYMCVNVWCTGSTSADYYCSLLSSHCMQYFNVFSGFLANIGIWTRFKTL